MAISHLIVSFFRRYALQLTLFLYTTVLVMQFPVSQNLIMDQLCRERYGHEKCQNLGKDSEAEAAIQAESSRVMSFQLFFTDVPGAIASLLLGALSDRVGRKRIMLMPCCGGTLLAFLMIYRSTMYGLSPPLLILSSVIFGVSGGIHTFMTTAVNMITDKTPVEKRTEAISRTMPFVGVGMMVGMLASGFFQQILGPTPIYIICAMTQLIVVLIVALFVEETLPSKNDPTAERGDGVEKSGDRGIIRLIWDSLTAGVRAVSSRKTSNARLQLLMLLGAGMINNASAMLEVNLVMMYTKRAPFSWSPSTFGIYTAVKSLLGIIGQVVGTNLFLRFLGERSLKNDFVLLQYGSLSALALTAATSLAPSTKYLVLSTIFLVFGAPARSANGSIVSRLVNPEQKGAFMALAAFLNTLTNPVLGFVYNGIYASTMETSPGAVFMCMAVVHGAVFCAIKFVTSYTSSSPDPDKIS